MCVYPEFVMGETAEGSVFSVAYEVLNLGLRSAGRDQVLQR